MTAENSSPNILDMEVLNMLKQSLGENRTNEIIAEFQSLLEKNIEEALKALDAKDYETFGKECHKVKSNVAYVGGKELSTLCIKIEEACYNKNYDAVTEMGEKFRTLSETTMNSLENSVATP